MEHFFLLPFTIIVTCLLSLAFLRRLIGSNKLKSPPGPKPWPIIGNLNLIGALPHRSLYLLSKKYGDIMQLRFGSSPVIVVSSSEMAKEFLKTHDQIFLSRPPSAAGRLICYNSSTLSWAPYGPYWRKARKICSDELFSTRQLDASEYIRVEEMGEFRSQLYSLVGKPIILREHLLSFTMASISRMAVGEKYFVGHGSNASPVTSQKELQELIEEFFSLAGAVNIGDYIPWLGFLDLQGYVKRMKAFHRKSNDFTSYVINDHRGKRQSSSESFKPKDIVDVLIQQLDGGNQEVQLTIDNVKGIIQDMFSGGTDTSAITIEWAISELLKHPLFFEKATEELDRVIGRERWVEEKDSARLPFIDAIVKETMRMHPITTLMPPHFSSEDCEISGYHIPKGSTLFVNIWSLGRDPRYWDKPEEFCPDRFLGKDIDETGQYFEFLPFSSGRRMCPGYKLGMRMVRSTLANLIHGFRWKLPNNMKPDDMDMEEEYGLTTHRKTPTVAVIEPRLEHHMYLAGAGISNL